MMLFNLFHSAILRAIDTAAVRVAARILGVGVLVCVLGSALVRGEDMVPAGDVAEAESTALTQAAPSDGVAVLPATAAEPAADRDDPFVVHPPKEPEPPPPEKPVPAEPAARVEYFLEKARLFSTAGDRAAAEQQFALALHEDVPAETKRVAMLELARFFEQGGEASKEISVLEKFRSVCSDAPEVPATMLRLGILYRESGAVDMATARFFDVLNSTLGVSPSQLEAYRNLAMKARLEIAETYAMQGKMEDARRYYARLQVLDLEPADRELVLFRSGQLQYGLGEWLKAESQMRIFLGEYPKSGHMAEARYLRAKALKELGRTGEAVQEVVDLLSAPDPGEAAGGDGLIYWKRRTGNELANRFYEQGDFTGALAIYQALARASEDPLWRWPAVYQIGLCFERLNMPTRAAEAYQTILAASDRPAPADRVDESLESIQGMARWRLEHLDWVEDFGKRLQGLAAEMTVKS